MSNVSVEQLAQQVRIAPERLLHQLKEAGIEIKHIKETITDAQKRTLLIYLQQSHALRTASPQTESVSASGSTPFVARKATVSPGVHRSGSRQKSVPISLKAVRKRIPIQPIVPPTEESVAETEWPQDASGAIECEHKPEQQIESAPAISENQTTLQPDLLNQTISVAPQETLETESKKKKEVRFTPATESDKSNKKKGIRRVHHLKGRSHRFQNEEDDATARGPAFKGDRVGKKQKIQQHSFEKPVAPVVREVLLPETITVSDLANKMSVKAAQVIKIMMSMGVMATINQVLDQETAVLVVEEMGHQAKSLKENAIEDALQSNAEDLEQVARAPVVTVMGHVDHGKTSLLDYIRRTKVTSTEAGGITQHIGAYHVDTDRGMVTFLDTPGHAAFTAMRARGVKCTDIVVLVVAADDGVMPQTTEAIQHAQAAQVPIVVAVNKMDKSDADPERIRQELMRYHIVPEEWGGEHIFQNISAKTGEGVDALLESILLQAEILELKAPINGQAQGVVVESRLDRSRGVAASVLITSGTLKKGDVVLVGCEYGRIRTMMGDNHQPREEAGPSMPVEIFGLSGAPASGETLFVVPTERKAREIALFRQSKHREVRMATKNTIKLENIFETLSQGNHTLNLIVKTDVQGSLEAICDALTRLSTQEVSVNIVASGVGGITESDVHLSIASSAILIGFNVRPDSVARSLIEREHVDLRYYSIIYQLVDEIRSALSGLLKPEYEEKITGLAVVREVFRSSHLGAIAGCMVLDGTIKHHAQIRVLRNNVVVYTGVLESLRRFKDSVHEARQGMECGIGVKDYNEIHVNDQIETYEKIQIKRVLN